MKRIIQIFTLLIILSLCIVGCSTGKDSAGGSSDKSGQDQAQTETTDTSSDTTSSDSSSDTKTDASNSKAASSDSKSGSYESKIPEETQNFMNNITGTWESSTPLEDGNANIVRVKIDNVSGFTFTTGTQTPDGTGSFYSRVGSYEIEGDTIRFSATTGGESNDGSSYNLRQDFGVFEYTISENPELTQIVLTPVNDRAKLLTGDGAVTLNKV